MQVDYPRVWPFVIAVLAVLLIYRRLRRSFGRQPVRPIRMWIRIGILTILGCSLVPAALKSGQFLAAEVAGILAGTALGIWGAQHTRYQRSEGQLTYAPHTYTGIAVSLLFVGRLVYRAGQMYSMHGPDGAMTDTQDLAASPMVRGPFTVGLLFVVIGYYVCYFSRVLWKSKRISPEELEVTATSDAMNGV
jgi:hypothetical protein